MRTRNLLWRKIQRYLIKLPLPLRQFFESIRFLRLRLRRQHYWFERACRQEFFRRAFVALSFNKIDGDYVEFGCHGGMTFGLAYQESRRAGHSCILWGFDSFSGLPAQKTAKDDHPQWIQGTMHTDLDEFRFICKYNGVPLAAYRVVPGFYEGTLVPDLSATSLPTNICMAYIDCDLYTSTLTVLNFLLPRFKHGMILAFDDYFCWSNTQVSGERRAIEEVLASDSNWQLVPYIQYGWHGMSFVVESKKAWVSDSSVRDNSIGGKATRNQ
jgi:O-methyltransferase